MTSSLYKSRLLRVSAILIAGLTWLANNTNPPTGRTGAPFDGHCNDCHTGNSNNYNGTVTIDGLPATIEPNTTYPLQITMTPTAGNPSRGGFQLVVVDGNNGNAGNLTNSNAQSGTEMFATREYLEQRNGKNFTGGNPITWSFTWASPASVPGNTVKFYYVGNFCDGNNSSGDYALDGLISVPFSGPPPVIATIFSSTNVSCFGGNNGSAIAEGDGGQPPYTYAWSNGQTGQTASNLTAGNYTVTVTGSGGSGTATASVMITQPLALNASVSVSGQANCNQPEVTVTGNVSGGTPGYQYAWPNGETNAQTQLGVGSYVLTVTDANSCTKTATFNIGGNTTPPNAVANSGAPLSCTQLTTTVSGTGSSVGGSFTYLWTSPNGNIVSGGTTLNAIVNQPGEYILQVTNIGNGCTATASTTVTSNATPPGASASGGTITCSSSTTSLAASSPTNGVTYLWSGPGINQNNQAQQNPVVGTAGVYTVTVTNPANSCTSTATATVNANTTPPSATAMGGTLTCSAPSITLQASSNAPQAVYQWTGPGITPNNQNQQNPLVSVDGSYLVVVTNPTNGCTNTASAIVNKDQLAPNLSASASGQLTCATNIITLSANSTTNNVTYAWSGPNGFSSSQQSFTTSVSGTYTVVVTAAANGCTSSTIVNVTENTTPPTVSIAPPANLNCNTTSIQLDASASSQGGNFIYSWSTINGNFVSGQNTLSPTVNAPGQYNLLIINSATGCTASAGVVVQQSPAVMAAIAQTQAISCNGGNNGALLATATGSGAITYLWSNGATTPAISNLIAGVYSLSISDAEGCTATQSFTLTQPAALQANVSVTNQTAVGVNDGTATAAPTGGTPAYTYLWSTNATTAGISGLAPGTYTVTIGDANGCTSVQAVNINSFGCTLSLSVSAVNISCNAAANGSALATVSGANEPVTYLWSNGAGTASISGLAPGTYTVQVSDANNCPAQQQVQITEPAVLNANVTATNVSGAGATDGTATAAPTGGTAPYTYLWNTGATTAGISGLAPGTYTCVVTDAQNCSSTQSASINAFNCTLTVSLTQVNIACAGTLSGQITAAAGAGSSPFTYLWSTGATTASIVNLGAGTYTVTASDNSGCTTTAEATISEPAPLVANVENIVNVTCATDLSGSAAIVASGGTAPYTIAWPNNSGGQNLSAGAYFVTVTDANGCSRIVTANISVSDNIAPGIACPGNISLCGFDIVDYPQPTVSDNCTLPANALSLVSGQASGSIFLEGVSTQVFQVTDAAGNTAQCSFSVTIFELPDVGNLIVTNDVGGAGLGAIAVTPMGGTAPYTFVWTKDGVFFSNSEDLSSLNSGSYQLVMSDANGCNVTLAPVFVDNLVSTTAPDVSFRLGVMPNPATQQIFLQWDGPAPELLRISGFNGGLVRDIPVQSVSGGIDVSSLPAGLYLLQLYHPECGWQLSKWIKNSEQ